MKHLLSINDLSIEEITEILDAARVSRHLVRDHLEGYVVALLFFEDSTRTRISFELAARRLGAEVVNFSVEGSSVSKGESLIDTALTLQAMGVHAFVVRASTPGAPATVARWVKGSVINAGDGINEHPTQALLDLYTMREHFGQIAGLHVGIIGDVKYSRVANSLKLALAKMGAKVTLTGPRELVSSRPGAGVVYDFETVLPTLDVCYLLRYQKERHPVQYAARTGNVKIELPTSNYCLTEARAEMLPSSSIIMHPGPINRGVEIAGTVADSPQSKILRQVTNGVAVRAAVLSLLLEGGEG